MFTTFLASQFYFYFFPYFFLFTFFQLHLLPNFYHSIFYAFATCFLILLWNYSLIGLYDILKVKRWLALNIPFLFSSMSLRRRFRNKIQIFKMEKEREKKLCLQFLLFPTLFIFLYHFLPTVYETTNDAIVGFNFAAH